MFSKILIANRGEIAVRIIRACHEMGISAVAVYSEADKNALHVSLADESYCIGGPQVGDSYLNMAAILTVAVATGAKPFTRATACFRKTPNLFPCARSAISPLSDQPRK